VDGHICKSLAAHNIGGWVKRVTRVALKQGAQDSVFVHCVQLSDLS
jgi:hypothetical protein